MDDFDKQRIEEEIPGALRSVVGRIAAVREVLEPLEFGVWQIGYRTLLREKLIAMGAPQSLIDNEDRLLAQYREQVKKLEA